MVTEIRMVLGETMMMGEYIGVIHDSSPGSDDDDDDSDDDEDEEDNDENGSGSGSACMKAAHRYQRQLSNARRRQLNRKRKHMYKLRLHNYSGSIRPHKQGNWTRFINHSSQSPNCRYECQMATHLTTVNCIAYAHGSCLMYVDMRSGHCPRGFRRSRSFHAWRCALHYLA